MKRLIWHLIKLPFSLLTKLSYRNSTLLFLLSESLLPEGEKIRIAQGSLFRTLANKEPKKGFKVISYVNALNDKSPLALAYARNLVECFPRFESQLGQDCLVDTLFKGKSEGVFVEIGVGNGKEISNTYFLEKYRNWNGILCEPSKRFHDSIANQRSARLVTDAAYNKSGLELDFSEVQGVEELSTLTNHKETDSHPRIKVREYPVKTISFNDLCDSYLPNKRIDYLSIDTEGSEVTILEAINFDSVEIGVISIEHNYDQLKRLRIAELLNNAGFDEVLDGVFEYDSFFINRSFFGELFAKPEKAFGAEILH